MTSSVKITACCDPSTKEVRVKISDTGELAEEFTLQHGESEERYVYDNRVISVSEVEK